MLLAGDEIGHTQHGNNNGYFQDNEITWLRWDHDEPQGDLLQFVRDLSCLRREQPVLLRRFFHGETLGSQEAPSVAWLGADGDEMSPEAWTDGFSKCLGMVLFGGSVDVNPFGEEVAVDTLLAIFNADHGDPIPFALPNLEDEEPWELLLDTTDTRLARSQHAPGEKCSLTPASLAVFRMGINAANECRK